MLENAAIAMRHLLVVDDDAATADVMRMGLEADGTCRVTIAPCATEALAAIERDPPHAAIIDAVLPRVPGLVLARTVIDLGVPVLIVSGDLAVQKGLAEAGCPFLLKPFRLSELAAETRMLLDTATARRIEVARARPDDRRERRAGGSGGADAPACGRVAAIPRRGRGPVPRTLPRSRR